jgi:hypothetical protein
MIMDKVEDYATAVFVQDCREKSLNGVITRRQLKEAFWDHASDLRTALDRAHIPVESISDAIETYTFPCLIETLRKNGISVMML